MKARTLFLLAIASLAMTSCASIMNLHNNKSWKMGIDVVTENASPIDVTVNGKGARYYRLYEGNAYFVDRVILRKPKRELEISITQNGITRSRTVHGDKVKGLFWFTGLWVILDHAKGTLRQYPAVVFNDMDPVGTN
jgi:hypothetical protein